MDHQISSVGPYILGRTLGRGATGKVKLAYHRESGERVAVKIVTKEFLFSSPNMRRKVEREIAIMKLLDNPHVLSLLDVYETTKYLFLVLEHVEGGELFDYLVKRGSLPLPEAMTFFLQILQGVEYCHAHFICHRDLKPENLLLDANKNVKIADWGMASLMRNGALLETSCGSPHYASPEVIMGKKYDGRCADIWSLGVILYALLTGKLPFDDENMHLLLGKVKSGYFAMPQWLPSDVKDLLQRMLTVDPAKRIMLHQIFAHPALTHASQDYVGPTSLPLEQKIARPLDDEPLDDEILRSLHSLGWDNREELHRALLSSEPTVEKAYYRLLSKRKRRRTKGRRSGGGHVQKMDTESYEMMPSASMPIPASQARRTTAPMPIRSSPRSIPAAQSRSAGGHNNSVTAASAGSVPSADPIMAANNSPVLGSTPKKTWFASFFGSYKNQQQPPVGSFPSSSFGTPGSFGGFNGSGSFLTAAAIAGADGAAASPFASPSPSPSGASVPYTVRSTRPVAELVNLLRQALKEQQVVFSSSANHTFHAKYDALDAACAVSLTVELRAHDDVTYVHFTRRSGDRLTFQTLVDSLVASMHLL